MSKNLLVIGLIIIVVGAFIYFSKTQTPSSAPLVNTKSLYNPTINPADFSTNINNKYFTLKPGTKFVYNKTTEKGLEKVEIVVLNETREIMGVKTIGFRDTVTLAGQVIEDTKDWHAQDKNGNVWYFGEDVNNYENGKLKDHKGAWTAGVDGAKPGIIMEASPKVGDSYRQEYYKGQAEDMADAVALNKQVTAGGKNYTGCLQTRDWSKVDPELNEYKYYCPEVGFFTAGENVKDGKEKVELISISRQ